MGWFGKSKVGKALAGAAGAVQKDLTGNKDFLEAACAFAALMAGAEGGVSPAEKQMAIQAVSQSPKLGELFDRSEVEACMNKMISRVESATGRYALEGEMRDILKQPDGTEMAKYVAFIGYDVMMADGNAGEKEKARFAKGCALLNLDPTEFYES